MLIVLFYVLFLCKYVLYYSHRVSTRWQLTNISNIKYAKSPPPNNCVLLCRIDKDEAQIVKSVLLVTVFKRACHLTLLMYVCLNFRIICIRAGLLQPSGASHNSLRTPLRAALVFSYIGKVWGSGRKD